MLVCMFKSQFASALSRPAAVFCLKAYIILLSQDKIFYVFKAACISFLGAQKLLYLEIEVFNEIRLANNHLNRLKLG